MGNPTNLIRSVFTLGIAQMLTWVGSAVLTILLPRYLGDANLGKLTIAIALTSLLGLFADLGATTYLTKEVARAPERAGQLTTNLLALRIPLSLIAGGLAGVIAHLAGYDPLTRSIVYVLSVGILLNAISAVVFGALQGLHQMKVLALTSVLNKLGYAAAAAALLLVGFGPLEVSVGQIVVSIFTLSLGTIMLMRRMRLTLHVEWLAWRALLVAGLPFFVWQAALLVYGQVDMLLLSFMTRDTVVGWYAAAYRIVMIPVFIPTILVTVIFPALSATAMDFAAFNGIARRAVQAVALISIPMALGTMLLADKIPVLLGYPGSFVQSVVPLILLAPHLPLAAIDVMIGAVLNTRDRQRQWALTGVAAAILNPLLNLIAIPYTQAVYDNGAIGAAAITTVTEVFMLLCGLRLLPSGIFNTDTLLVVARCLTAGLAMSVVVWFARDLPVVAIVAAGAIVYASACLMLGAVSTGELRDVATHLIKRQTPATGPSTP